jgi:hypothetical protein
LGDLYEQYDPRCGLYMLAKARNPAVTVKIVSKNELVLNIGPERARTRCARGAHNPDHGGQEPTTNMVVEEGGMSSVDLAIIFG